jgi:tetratricopeptide (TPR) repeat protein
VKYIGHNFGEGDTMKISLFSLGIICCIFFISTQDIYSMKRKHTEEKTQSSRGTKFRKTDDQQAVLTQDENSENLDEAEQDASAYIKKIKSLKLKALFFEAENLFNTDEFEKALLIYEKIVGMSNDPLALFRLGEIYQKMAEKNPKFLTKSYDYYKLALNNGFMAALEKLIEIGEALNELVKATQSKPMSDEVQRMYI